MDTPLIERSSDQGPEPKLWTADEYLKMAELGIFENEEPLELLEGEIVRKMSPIGVGHGVAVTRIFRWLVKVVPEGMDIYCQATARISIRSVPEPDFAVLKKPVLEFDKYPEASEIEFVIEVADSSLTLDRSRKARIYGAAGIAEYWVVNLRDRTIEAHREPQPDGFGFVKRYDAKSALTPLFTDVEVFVSDLLPREKQR